MKTQCILTSYCKNAKGYGVRRIDGKNFLAHRLSYAEANGLVTEDLAGIVIRHKCDNPAWVNPDHLVPGTHKDNSRDMVERGRQGNTRGERSGKAKLKEKEVIEILRRLSAGEFGTALAKEYGVGNTTIYEIKSGKHWAHLQENQSI
ncbi:HNH endonuclease [Paraburkholderia elongata]|uniref:HNH endonuclease n=1 Tax=Paraburkholderia elongata TaxID=2675747 RepID=A0A972SMN5_9BURK|nr:HNH endonuclease [Paraburkholderia elongata]NPT59080.1 HNH endonuclease [Paraburkholderia elongata]